MDIDLNKEFALEEDYFLEEPKMYKVILLNDDYTSMDFVVEVLVSIYSKSDEEAVQIMLDVHKKGKAICGVYVYEIAETKSYLTHKLARENNFPLKTLIEEV
jgi:ATP-dependent Clp protease adaptor protein ClpS